MKYADVLEEMGLTHAEALVYLALLDAGSTPVGPIIKKTGLHRGTTYQVLQRLSEKGLISISITDKKSFFKAVNPERILDIQDEKQKKYEQILPQLKSKLKTGLEKQDVTVYHGLNGIKTVLNKMFNDLKPNGKYYDFSTSGLIWWKELNAEWKTWQIKKKKLNIQSYVIFNEAIKTKNPKMLKEIKGNVKFVSNETPTVTDTIAYDDTVILFIWKGQPPIAIVIENKDNAQAYKNQFKLIWKQAKK